MTCREKLAIEHPDAILDWCDGGCYGCPIDYGYLPKPDPCIYTSDTCTACWNREIPEINNEKENNTMPMHDARVMTPDELRQMMQDLETQYVDAKRKEEAKNAANDLMTVVTGFVEAGFTREEAFTLLLNLVDKAIKI